ncbi:hypothetical protein, partial [Roseobacter sp.]|uniref:hypothetical protein n=1 Tax=Roseobacter sp. TaxID=1907202 RepID=UPI003298606B
PDQSVGRPVGCVCRDPIGFHAKALFGPVEHLAHCAHLGGLVRPAGVILARYDGTAAALIYWLRKIAAYPLMFFAVKMGLGISFLSFVVGVMTKLFAGRR